MGKNNCDWLSKIICVNIHGIYYTPSVLYVYLSIYLYVREREKMFLQVLYDVPWATRLHCTMGRIAVPTTWRLTTRPWTLTSTDPTFSSPHLWFAVPTLCHVLNTPAGCAQIHPRVILFITVNFVLYISTYRASVLLKIMLVLPELILFLAGYAAGRHL